MRRMLMTASFSMLVAMFAALPAWATTVMIDDFSTGSTEINIPTLDADPTTEVDAAGIGGVRSVMLDQTLAGDSIIRLNATVPTTGLFSLSNGDGAASIAMLTYDSGGAGLGGGLGVDLTGMGMNNTLFIDMIANDNGVSLKFEVMDFFGVTSSLTNVLGAVNVADQFFPFLSFSNQLVDFTKITKIKLTVTAVSDADVRFTLLDARTTVPEPSSLALLGFGAFSMVAGGFARRRKQQAV